MDREELTVSRRPCSFSAFLSALLGAGFWCPVGLPALFVGLIGLWQTRGRRRRGRKAAKWGVGLGIACIWLNVTGCPAVLFPLPIMSRDAAVRRWLSDMAAGRYDQARAGAMRTANTRNLNPTEFARWADAFNDYAGPGRLIWCAADIAIGQDGPRFYIIHFAKTGPVLVQTYYDQESARGSRQRWDLFTPQGFPHPAEWRFSDEGQGDD